MTEKKQTKLQRVLQVNLEDSGGAFSLVFQLQKQLKRRIAFDYYSMGTFRSIEVVKTIEELGGNVYEADLRANRFIGSVLLPNKFYHFLRERHYDCVHIHSDTAWKLLLYAFPATKAGVEKVIIHSHSTDINGDFRWLKRLCHKMALRLLPKYANVYLACSDYAMDWMFPQIPNNKIIWIRNGIDTQKFSFNEDYRNVFREKLGISSNIILIGVVGDMSFPKNPCFIVDVFAELSKITENYRLVFVGEGLNTDNIKKYVAEKGLNDFVIFYGRTQYVERVLSGLDIFALPSRFEGLPVSVIEAEASGLPCVISSKITRQTDIINGCRFIEIQERNKKEWADAIFSLSIPSDEERKMAWKKVQDAGFGIDTTAKQMMEIYKE